MRIKDGLIYGQNALQKWYENKIIAERLLEYVLKKDKVFLRIHSEDVMTQRQWDEYQTGIQEILKGKPLAYITHQVEFMGLPFYVDENVLIPRMDTEVLVEEILAEMKKNTIHSVLDMCTGSGAIAISLKKQEPALQVMASDISKNALTVAQKNAKILQAEIRFIQSDMWQKIQGSYDCIVSNPPYIQSHVVKTLDPFVQHEPHLALDGGEDGLQYYRILIKHAQEHLNQGGYLFLEIGYDQKESVTQLMQQANFQWIHTRKDYGGNDRVVWGKKEG